MAMEGAHVSGAITMGERGSKGDVGVVLKRCVSEARMPPRGTGILKKVSLDARRMRILFLTSGVRLERIRVYCQSDPSVRCRVPPEETRLSEESVPEVIERMRSDRGQTPLTIQETSTPSQREAEDEIQENADPGERQR
jgi:hypothetical protein